MGFGGEIAGDGMPSVENEGRNLGVKMIEITLSVVPKYNYIMPVFLLYSITFHNQHEFLNDTHITPSHFHTVRKSGYFHPIVIPHQHHNPISTNRTLSHLVHPPQTPLPHVRTYPLPDSCVSSHPAVPRCIEPIIRRATNNPPKDSREISTIGNSSGGLVRRRGLEFQKAPGDLAVWF